MISPRANRYFFSCYASFLFLFLYYLLGRKKFIEKIKFKNQNSCVDNLPLRLGRRHKMEMNKLSSYNLSLRKCFNKIKNLAKADKQGQVVQKAQ